ncbi:MULTISPECIES: VPLPA-CTERM sorting domain-containing protein [unclassified Roseovarius]|uniref:VPLPA-CTERM sorting domain-containing protein n=1 Tax=unclassified Roseovarius TaxID=2614913 RepID=UPI00273FB284|nr:MULTISPECIES: VPLPA-CTERM sorting domain-containing protein [unclassified Roseovarius]
MKIKHLFTAAVLSVGLGASSASAALLDLTEVLSFNANSFNSSMIHLQNKGRMNGKIVADVESAITGGTFDTVTGDIKFDGTIKNRSNGNVSAFSAMGSLMSSVSRAGGLFGNISFDFTSGSWAGYSLDFIFDDESYAGGEPNGFVTGGAKNYIALWGDTKQYRSVKNGNRFCRKNIGKCHGLDLRIAYEDNGGSGGVVPLPASFGFLLAGVGGFGFARKLRKKA